MHDRTPALLLAALAAAPVCAQTADDLFTEGTVLVDEWSCMRHALDLDGQGPLDMLGWWWVPGTNGQSARVRGWTSDGLGGLRQSWQLDTPELGGLGLFMSGSTLGDFDGDGDRDFVVGIAWYGHVYTREAAQPPEYYSRAFYPWDSAVWEHPLGMLATDCDGDGLDDLITATPRGLRLFRNMGPGVDFELSGWELLIDAEPHTLVEHYIETVFAELDGDATRPELVVLRHDSTTGVELRTHRLAGGGFAPPAVYALDVGPDSHLAAGDVDGDGDDDVVLFDPDGTYQVLRQGATGQLAVEQRAPGGPATHLADIDADGDLDGICCGGGGGARNPENDAPSTFHIALNLGGGEFAPASTFAGLGSEGIAGFDDVDGDGDVDLFAGRVVLTNHLAVGTVYCDAEPSSTGAPATLTAAGSASLARADLELHAADLPPASLAVLLAGGSAAQLPMGEGWLCVGAPARRIATAPSGTGSATFTPGAPHLGAGTVPQPGETRYFQCWFRDPGAPGTAMNSSAGLRVTYAP